MWTLILIFHFGLADQQVYAESLNWPSESECQKTGEQIKRAVEAKVEKKGLPNYNTHVTYTCSFNNEAR